MMSTQYLYDGLFDPTVFCDVDEYAWQDLIFVLREAKLLAALYHRAIDKGCFDVYPAFAQRHLHSAQVYAGRQTQQIHFEARELQQLFDEIGVSAIFLKGAAYALAETNNSAGRLCSDLDVLVSKNDLPKAEAHLKQHLWKPEILSDYDEKYYRKWAHEIPPMVHINRATVIDMHHNLYPPISGRNVNIANFLNAQQCVSSGCKVLAPWALTLHSIIHMFANEDSSSWMRDLFDIALLIEEFATPAFWSELVDQISQTDFTFEFVCCVKSLQHYTPVHIPENVDRFVAQHSLSTRQIKYINTSLIPAIAPEHDLVVTDVIKRAKFKVYVRGHRSKMPLPVLLKHTIMKGIFGIRDQVFGKYFFDPEQFNKPF